MINTPDNSNEIMIRLDCLLGLSLAGNTYTFASHVRKGLVNGSTYCRYSDSEPLAPNTIDSCYINNEVWGEFLESTFFDHILS